MVAHLLLFVVVLAAVLLGIPHYSGEDFDPYGYVRVRVGEQIDLWDGCIVYNDSAFGDRYYFECAEEFPADRYVVRVRYGGMSGTVHRITFITTGNLLLGHLEAIYGTAAMFKGRTFAQASFPQGKAYINNVKRINVTLVSRVNYFALY